MDSFPGSRILFWGNRLGSSIVEIGNEIWSGDLG